MNITHNRTGTKEYRAWSSMITRCTNPNSQNYHLYGGRGITVCERWLTSFENFLEDLGDAPEPSSSLDRIDNSANYTPDNCRWADRSTQAKNRRARRPLLSDAPMRCIHIEPSTSNFVVRIRLNSKTRIQRTFSTLNEAADWRDLTEYEREFQRALGMR